MPVSQESLSKKDQVLSLVNSSSSSYSSKTVVKTSHGPKLSTNCSTTTCPPSTLNIIEVIPDIYASPMSSQRDISCKPSYFCVFCEVRMVFSTFMEAQFHFAKHLDYAPVVCLICTGRFQDLDTVMKHFKEDHGAEPNDNYLYFVNQDTKIENWIEDYLTFQSGQELHKLLDPNYALFCPVCSQLSKSSDVDKEKSLTVKLSHVIQHVNTHLNYRPYRCNICFKTGLRTSFPDLDEHARNHIVTHGYAPTDNFLRLFFIKSTIEPLESFIQNFILSEWYPMVNLKSAMGDSFSSPTSANVSAIKSKVPSTPFSLHFQQMNSPVSLQPSTNILKTTRSSQPLIQRITLSSLGRDPHSSTVPVVCYHCREIVEDLSCLRAHHDLKHPNQTVAGYAIP